MSERPAELPPARVTGLRAPWSTAARLAPLGLAMAILVFHAGQYWFVTDDAFISFVYSRNFAEHGQLAFNLGDPVEGYTNFLWTLLLGVLMVVGIPPEVSSLVLGLAWAYVVARVLHSAIHCSYNKVMHRFRAFALGMFVLLVLWTVLGYGLIAG